MSLPCMHYRVVGQDDYMLDIRLGSDGSYRVDCGDHTSHEPRRGKLDASQIKTLSDLVGALGTPREHPAPTGASGFLAELSIGEPPATRVYRVWEGELQQEPDIMALIRALEVI